MLSQYKNCKCVADALTEIGIDKDTAIVALTHDPKFDDRAISMGLKSSTFYVGALGGTDPLKLAENVLADGLTSEVIDTLKTDWPLYRC